MYKIYGLVLIVIAALTLLGAGIWLTSYDDGLAAPLYQATATRTPYGGGTVAPTITPTLTITSTFTVTPIPLTATPTPDSSLGPKVVEIFPCQGASCIDWNLRSGCGNNDLYVKIGNFSLDNLTGYSVAIVNIAEAEVCRYTFQDSNVMDHLKTIYLDQMLDPDGNPCYVWPYVGRVVIYAP